MQRVYHEHNKKFYVSFRAEGKINTISQFGERFGDEGIQWKY